MIIMIIMYIETLWENTLGTWENIDMGKYGKVIFPFVPYFLLGMAY
jgi:hypothetical protein